MGKTSNAVKNRYRAKTYDQFVIQCPKGRREVYKDFAASQGESLAGLVKRLLDAEMARVEMSERSG